MKILIIRLSAIGDVLRVLPALNSLREYFPEGEIHWLVEDKAAGILKNHPQIDRLIIFHRKKLKKELCSFSTLPNAISDLISFIKNLSYENYDLVFDFHGVFKSGLFSGLTFAPQRMGFGVGSSKEGNFLFNTNHCYLPDQKINRVDRNFELLKKYGIKKHSLKAVIPISEESKKFAKSFFREQNLLGKLVFALYPGSSPVAEFKRWHPQKYIDLCSKLEKKYNSTILLLWGPGEEELIKKIKSALPRSIVAPPTSLEELASLISISDIFIGGDTGPMHMSWLMGIPTVAIFGPTDPEENCPPSQSRSAYIFPEIDCAPCRKKECKKALCIEAVTVEMVLEKTINLLSSKC